MDADERWTRMAERVVDDRRSRYGSPAEGHRVTAALWSAYLEALPRRGVTTTDVCVLNILQKIARVAFSPDHEDHWVDIIGYALNVQLSGQVEKFDSDASDLPL